LHWKIVILWPKWYIALCDFQARNEKPDADGLFSGEPDGPSLALLALAYELYILESDLLVQEKLIRRLLHRDQFQGARYEITVAHQSKCSLHRAVDLGAHRTPVEEIAECDQLESVFHRGRERRRKQL
jgi:hypothetical protein